VDFRIFYGWEKMITNNYSILFERPSLEQENRVVVPAKDKIPDELNYVALIDRLSNGDITKHKEIYVLNYVECLNLLAFWYHRDKYQAKVQREIERKYNK